MPKTDLIQYRIPTYHNAILRVSKPSLYIAEELKFQKQLIPELIQAGIISQCESPWSAKIRFPRKSNGKLRMVHVFTGLNDVTVKPNYPKRCIGKYDFPPSTELRRGSVPRQFPTSSSPQWRQRLSLGNIVHTQHNPTRLKPFTIRRYRTVKRLKVCQQNLMS